MKTSELIGPALDWAVAKCEGYDLFVVGKNAAYYSPTHGALVYALYSTKWEQGGPIIEREKIELTDNGNNRDEEWCWSAHICCTKSLMFGKTALIAAMRCYVASKLGDEVDIPKELLEE